MRASFGEKALESLELVALEIVVVHPVESRPDIVRVPDGVQIGAVANGTTVRILLRTDRVSGRVPFDRKLKRVELEGGTLLVELDHLQLVKPGLGGIPIESRNELGVDPVQNRPRIGVTRPLGGVARANQG